MLGHRRRRKTQTVYYWRGKTPPTNSEYEYFVIWREQRLNRKVKSLSWFRAQARILRKKNKEEEKKPPPTSFFCTYSQKRRETKKGKWRGNGQSNLSIFKADPLDKQIRRPIFQTLVPQDHSHPQ